MVQKAGRLLIEVVVFYLVALLLSVVFHHFGWIEEGIFPYSLCIAAGWIVGKLIWSMGTRIATLRKKGKRSG